MFMMYIVVWDIVYTYTYIYRYTIYTIYRESIEYTSHTRYVHNHTTHRHINLDRNIKL